MPYDVILDADGDLPVFCRLESGITAIAQRVKITLGTLLGEWMLDTSVGIDYPGLIQQKPFSEIAASALFKSAIEAVPGVVSCDNWVTSFVSSTQTFSATGEVKTEDGVLLVEIPAFSALSGNVNTAPIFIDAMAV